MLLSIDVGTKNLAYCVLNTETEEIQQWDNISLESDPKNMNKLCMELIQTMDMLGIAENMNTILIEKQPKVNPKMRSVAACLQTYFMIRSCVDLGEDSEVILYSPKYKLNCYTGPPLEVSGTNQYYRNKMMGIAHCRALLTEKNESWKDFFESRRKKDDLADSFLQGLSYIRYNLKSEPLRPKVPSRKQLRYNLYSKANLMYFLKNSGFSDGGLEELRSLMNTDNRIASAINKNYNNIDEVLEDWGKALL